MLKRIKLLWKAYKLKNTLKRVQYRIYLWKMYRGEVPVKVVYNGRSVSVDHSPQEMFIRNYRTVFGIGVMFKSTPSGRFVSDESFSKIELCKEDKSKGFVNPFEKEQIEELRTMSRVLTYEERLRKSLIGLMDKAEWSKFNDR